MTVTSSDHAGTHAPPGRVEHLLDAAEEPAAPRSEAPARRATADAFPGGTAARRWSRRPATASRSASAHGLDAQGPGAP